MRPSCEVSVFINERANEMQCASTNFEEVGAHRQRSPRHRHILTPYVCFIMMGRGISGEHSGTPSAG